MSAILFLASLAIAASPPAGSDPARSVIRREVIDLRDLPARTRVSALSVALRGRADSDARRPWVSMAVNGVVVARARLDAKGAAALHMAVDERLMSMRTLIEIAAYVPHCGTPSCRALAASVQVAGPVRQEHDAARANASFAQLASRYRAGMTILRGRDVDPAFAARIRDALAPKAPPLAKDGGTVILARRPPPDLAAPIRFDLGPVGLVRQDGVPVIAPDRLAGLTVVQVLRAGDRPVIWVRPGRDVPRAMDLDSGNVAVLGRAGPVIAYSSQSDAKTLHPAYREGVDADGSRRAMRLWRWLLLVLWTAASGGLWVVYRRLPRRVTPVEVPAWAA